MLRAKKQQRKKAINYTEESLSDSSDDYEYGKETFKKKAPTGNKSRKTRHNSLKPKVPQARNQKRKKSINSTEKLSDSSDSSNDYECDKETFKKKASTINKSRKTRHNSLKPKAPFDKKYSSILEILDSDNEDISHNIKKAHEQDIENKVNGFVKQFDSEDDDDFFKSTPVSKVEHKPDKRSKNDKDMYVLSSDTEPDDVKPSTSTCNMAKKKEVTDNNRDLKEVKSISKTPDNLFCFIDDIIKKNSIITTGVDKVKECINKAVPSFEDLMKKTDEILLTTVIGNFTSKPKEPEVQTIVIEKEGPSCPVCLETLNGDSKVMVTLCGHMFCESCIIKVVQTMKRCPTCRKTITKKKYHPVYLPQC